MTSPARDPLSLPHAPEPAPPTPEFLDRAAAMGVEFEPGDLDRLGRYLALLRDANKVMNLTGVDDPRQGWIKHILDSLSLLPVLAELPQGAAVLDVGSGAGLPGLPLAIALPNLRVTLLEATAKKAEFLRHAVRELALPNVVVLAARAEAAGQDRGERAGSGRTPGHREAYDAVVARAVGPLSVIAELTVPFAKVGGLVVLIKGEKADEELAAAERALRELKAVHESTIDTPTGKLAILGKRSATPRPYPRRDGEPKRAPL